MKKALFIINPKSGAMHKEHFENWIQHGVDRSKLDFQTVYTKYPGHATELSREAAGQHLDLVVAVGGDGSVNEVGAGLVGSQTALGIIPTGSGNGMARHLGIPMKFQDSLQVLNEGFPTRIDSFLVNSHFGIGTFGIGFDAHIAHLFAHAGTRGYSTYVKLVLTEFYKYKAKTYQLVLDGTPISGECFLLTFANSSQFGNNAVIAPFADVTDGLLEVTMMKKFPVLAAPRLIYRMMNNTLQNSRFFRGKQARSVTVLNQGTLKGHIDGEPHEFSGDIQVSILPKSINVWVQNKSST